MIVETVPVERVIPYARNPRRNDKAVAKVAASIKEFGFRQPIVVDPEMVVVVGHTRLLAARQLGLAEVPVHVAEGLTPAQAKAYRLADNRTNEESEWDSELLGLELGDLRAFDFDLSLTGFDADEIAKAEAGPVREESADVDLTLPSNPKSERGVVYSLGRHRVMCGDCRDFSDVEKLMAGARANVVITSPPYASQREYDPSSGFTPIPADEYVEWYRDVAANVMAVLAEDGSYFLNIKEHCVDGQRSLYVKDLTIAHVREWGWRFVDELIWHKQGMPGLYGDRFKNEFEPVFHFAKGACKTRFANVEKDSDNVPSGSVGSNAEMQGKGDPLRGRGKGKALPGNVIWAAPDVASAGTHEARFPVALPAFFVRAFSDAGDVVVDTFAGSGTTLIATEREGRVGYGMELSPAYCDVIRRRYAEFVNDTSLAP